MSFFLDCCNGNDLGPELTYRAPIDALTPLELEIITASYIGSRVVDLNKVGSKFGDRTLMDLGLRFPSALAFILPASAADAQAATTAPKSRSPGDGAPKLQDSGGNPVTDSTDTVVASLQAPIPVSAASPVPTGAPEQAGARQATPNAHSRMETALVDARPAARPPVRH